MSTPIFYLHVQARGCQAEVRLNDAPVIELSLDFPQHAFPTISEWVVNGDNTLSVHVDQADASAELRVTLCQAKLGDIPEPGQELELAVIEWPPPLLPGMAGMADAVGELSEDVEPPAMPPVLSAVGFARHPWTPWAWEGAARFGVDRRTTAEVVAWVRDLHATLAAGQIDPLAAVSKIKFHEVAPPYGMTPAEAQTRLTQTWGFISAQTGWALADFDEADLDLRLRCDGRLIEPCTREGAPIIRQARPLGGDQWAMPIFIARTNRDYVANFLTVLR